MNFGMYGTYCRLNVPVFATKMAVIRAARKKVHAKMRRNPKYREARHDFYRKMIEYHERAFGLFSNSLRRM